MAVFEITNSLVHEVAPVPEKVPATHSLHAAALTFDHVPPRHFVHTLLACCE